MKALMDSKKHISKAAGLRLAGALLVFALGLLVTGVRGIRRAPDRRATIGGRSPEPVR